MIPRQTLFRLRNHAIRPKSLQMVRSDPDGAVPRGKNRFDSVLAEPFVLGEAGYAKVAQHIDALRCANPEVTLSILEETVHAIAGQAIYTSKMIDVCTMDSIDALTVCSDP